MEHGTLTGQKGLQPIENWYYNPPKGTTHRQKGLRPIQRDCNPLKGNTTHWKWLQLKGLQHSIEMMTMMMSLRERVDDHLHPAAPASLLSSATLARARTRWKLPKIFASGWWWWWWWYWWWWWWLLMRWWWIRWWWWWSDNGPTLLKCHHMPLTMWKLAKISVGRVWWEWWIHDAWNG